MNEEKVKKYDVPSVSPIGWDEAKTWLKSLGGDEAGKKVADALNIKGEDEAFLRTGEMLASLSYSWTKDWNSFSRYFGNTQRAEKIIDILNLDEKEFSEVKKIRMIDLLFDARAANIHLTGLREVLSWFPSRENEYDGVFSDGDWDALIGDILDKDSTFLSDMEMEKLNENPRSVDKTKRPARYLVTSYWTGRAQIPEVMGDFLKSIKMCKESVLNK